MVKIGDTFKIGEVCQESGVYKLTNCTGKECKLLSKAQHTIPLAKGNIFPPCRTCNGKILWKLIQKA